MLLLALRCIYVITVNNIYSDSSITPLLGGKYPLKMGRGVVHVQDRLKLDLLQEKRASYKP